MNFENAKEITIHNKQVKELLLNGGKVWKKDEDLPYLTITAIEEDSMFLLRLKNTSSQLLYSVDKQNWIPLEPYNPVELRSVGDEIYLRGSITNASSTDYTWFGCVNGKVLVSGSIMSILVDDPDGTQLPCDYCCYKMFTSGDNIEFAVQLPATTLTRYCYSNMFSYCPTIITMPELPALTLTAGCYESMFEDCVWLTTLSTLPATHLAYRCYANMFNECTELTDLPALPATELALSCYEGMFKYCTSIKLSETQTGYYIKNYRIPTEGVGTDSDWALAGMFDNTSGTFAGTPTINTTYYLFDYNAISYLTFTAEEANSTIGLASKNSTAELKYSIDKADWTELNVGDTITLTNVGDKVYFRGSVLAASSSNYTNFTMTGKIAASGSIMSILCDDSEATALPCNYCCYELFNDCGALTVAPELPATALTTGCYASMFRRCFSLITPPILPATILMENCYLAMFNLDSFTTPPALPATSLAKGCYQSMFAMCDITTAPELPATTLAENCYASMFSGCFLLQEAPALPATTLAAGCYTSMFSSNRALTDLPELPATTLTENCYKEMFKGCTNIKISATQVDKYVIPYRIPQNGSGTIATGSLADMFTNTGGTFTGTPELQTIYYLYDASYEPSNYLEFIAREANSTIGLARKNSTATLLYSTDKQSWKELTTNDTITLKNKNDRVYLKGTSTAYNNITQFKMTGKIAAQGSIMSIICDNASALVLPHNSCCRNMFYDCTSLITPPELPATVLTDNCYSFMFYNCTSLVTAPALPATLLTKECYNGMFMFCSVLAEAPALPATVLAVDCYNSMFSNCKSLITPPELPAMTLQENCYLEMFKNCTSLITLPVLQSGYFPAYCCSGMFFGCTKIKLRARKLGYYEIAYRIPATGDASASSTALTNMFANTGGEFTDTPTINTTYYLWYYDEE